MNYANFEKILGYDRNAAGPTPRVVYFAYKNGKSTIFSTQIEALGHSRIVERYVENQTEIDAFKNSQNELRVKIRQVWNDAVRAYFQELDDQQFQILSEAAYISGVEGADAVFEKMLELADFYNQMTSAK